MLKNLKKKVNEQADQIQSILSCQRLCFSRLKSPVRVFWVTYPRNFLASYLVSMVSRVLWSPEGLVEVCVSWSGHPRYQKKRKM